MLGADGSSKNRRLDIISRISSQLGCRRRRVATGLGCVATVSALVACGVSAPGSAQAAKSSRQASNAGGTLVWAMPGDVVSTDPASDGGGNAVDWGIYDQVYNTLVTITGSDTVTPSLAISWTHPSAKKYIFTIRRGVKFSNGTALTVADVVGTLQRIMSPKIGSDWAANLQIASVAAIGGNRVEVTLKAPLASFLLALAMPQTSILPIEALNAGTFNPAKQLLGTGPYEVKSHIQGQSWILTRNPYYWGSPAKASTVDIKIITNQAAQVAALRSGSADVTTFDSPQAIALLKGQPNITTVQQQANLYYRLDVNAKSSLFSDPRLREALSLSINRNEIDKVALAGVGEPSAAITPDFKVCNPASMPYATPNLAKAKALVAAAGATGKTVTIQAVSNITTALPIAEVLQQGLQAAGLKVNVLQPDPGTWVKDDFNGKTANFDLSISYSSSYADPSMLLSNYNPVASKYNLAYTINHPAFDRLINTVAQTPAGNERNGLIDQACKTVASDANVIPLVTKSVIVAYRNDKIGANIEPVEAYDTPLSNLAQFSVK
jgi:peptide/nickel transport system substrate-binding protein